MNFQNKTIWGISCLNHDASISVIRDNEILFAAHSERYSRTKNDKYLNPGVVCDALYHGEPHHIVYYENDLRKRFRQVLSGDSRAFQDFPKKHLKDQLPFFKKSKFHSVDHHHSHASAGYYTSNFNDAAIIVADAIGEFETFTIWKAVNGNLKKLYSTSYPDSPGLFYSAMTQRCGFKPNEEEYIMMGLAAYGEPKYKTLIKQELLAQKAKIGLFSDYNLHRGCQWWRPEIKDVENIAASAQHIYEVFLYNAVKHAKKLTNSNNLIIMGGCALNCVANSHIASENIFENIWIMPNPGDAGSSLGAALALVREKVEFKNCFLGTNINKQINPLEIAKFIKQHKIAGLATGRAEFGPRALGHRSILADPRGDKIQDQVNEYKKREPFRPFAPAILEEDLAEYFDMPGNISASPYMQFIGKTKKPKKFPAITHIDGTARIQTVNQNDNPVLYQILKEWKKLTKCPMLLNTSLNIKGEPLVNTQNDADRFSKKNNLKVF